MAVLTHIDLSDAQRIGHEYGLSVQRIEGILAGSVNTNYRLHLGFGAKDAAGDPKPQMFNPGLGAKDAAGDPKPQMSNREDGSLAFLRIYEEQDERGATEEARLLFHLAERGVPTVRPLRRQSDGDGPPSLTSHAGKAAAIFPWIQGEILCQSRVTPAVMEQVGEALARIHTAGEGFRASPSRFDAEHLFSRLRRLRAEGHGGALGADIDFLFAALTQHVEVTQAAGLGTGADLVHGDVFRDNVLWGADGRIAAVLDFESASVGSVTFDLAVTMLAWCCADMLEGHLAKALFAGYTKTRPLTDIDRARFYRDAEFASLRFAITRITDYELRPRGTGIYKDYHRFMGRLSAVQGMGPRGLAAFVGI